MTSEYGAIADNAAALYFAVHKRAAHTGAPALGHAARDRPTEAGHESLELQPHEFHRCES